MHFTRPTSLCDHAGGRGETPRYFRPTEVEILLGDPTKAHTVLGWKPQASFPDLVKTMVEADLQEAQRDQLCQTHGFAVHRPEE